MPVQAGLGFAVGVLGGPGGPITVTVNVPLDEPGPQMLLALTA